MYPLPLQPMTYPAARSTYWDHGHNTHPRGAEESVYVERFCSPDTGQPTGTQRLYGITFGCGAEKHRYEALINTERQRGVGDLSH